MSSTVRCAWCGAVMREGDVTHVSRGLCASCMGERGQPCDDLTYLPDEVLDDLPFGVILLDPFGHVLAYNQCEQQVAPLNRDRVLGHNFFVEVAPCAHVNEFFGQYLALTRPSARRRSAELDVVFRLDSGSSFVRVKMHFDPHRAEGMLLLERQPTRSPRTLDLVTSHPPV